MQSANSEAFQKALKIPVRSRIRRSVKKENKGVLVFGKKGNNFVFRLGISPTEEIPVAPPLALKLFDAQITEEPQKVSDTYAAIYEHIKANLFKNKTHVQSEKLKREIKDKIELVIKENRFSQIDYLKDLLSVIELDALPRHYMRFINQLKVSDLDKLTAEISQTLS